MRASSSRLQLYAFSDKFWIHSKKLARGLPEPCRFPADLMRLAWPRRHFPNLLSVPLAGDSEKSLRRSCWLLVIPCAAWLHAVMVLSNIRSALCGRRPPVGFTLRASPSRLQLLRLWQILDASLSSEGQVPECCAQFWLGHIHRSLPLHSDLLFLGERLLLCWKGWTGTSPDQLHRPVRTDFLLHLSYLLEFISFAVECCQHSTHRSCLPML